MPANDVHPALLKKQLFHARDKYFGNDPDAKLFVKKELKEAVPLNSDAEVLKFASDAVSIAGIYAELGVFVGKSINFIAMMHPDKTIYGFDSFEGLPEDWQKGNSSIEKGTFALRRGALPPVLENVSLIKGWFSKTLPAFAEKKEKIAFLHIDCDLYSSTKTALRNLSTMLVPGSILIFDEFYNFPGFENHEYKAFQEFLAFSKRKANYLAYNQFHEQVVIELR